MYYKKLLIKKNIYYFMNFLKKIIILGKKLVNLYL